MSVLSTVVEAVKSAAFWPVADARAATSIVMPVSGSLAVSGTVPENWYVLLCSSRRPELADVLVSVKVVPAGNCA